MSSGVDIRDFEVLLRLKAAFSRFGDEASEVCANLSRALPELEAQLVDSEMHLHERLERAHEHYQTCREALQRCLSGGGLDGGEKSGPRDCGEEERAVREAEWILRRSAEKIAVFQMWRVRIEEMIPCVEQDCFRLKGVAEDAVESAGNFLQARLTPLHRYLAIQQGGSAASESEGNQGKPRLREVLETMGLLNDTVSASDVARLMTVLRQEKPAHADEVISMMEGFDANDTSADLVRSTVQDFLNLVSPSAIRDHPKFSIAVADLDVSEPRRTRAGAYIQAERKLTLHKTILDQPYALRETIFHEIMHWFVHHGSDAFKQRLSSHFIERTKGAEISAFRGFMEKRDEWHGNAGRVYSRDDNSGTEIAPVYVEALLEPAEHFVGLWNDPKFRETMLIVLEGMITRDNPDTSKTF